MSFLRFVVSHFGSGLPMKCPIDANAPQIDKANPPNKKSGFAINASTKRNSDRATIAEPLPQPGHRNPKSVLEGHMRIEDGSIGR